MIQHTAPPHQWFPGYVTNSRDRNLQCSIDMCEVSRKLLLLYDLDNEFFSMD